MPLSMSPFCLLSDVQILSDKEPIRTRRGLAAGEKGLVVVEADPAAEGAAAVSWKNAVFYLGSRSRSEPYQ